MGLSTLVGLVWVLFVSAAVRGWGADHPWLGLWVLILGVAYVVLRVLEYLGVLGYRVPVVGRRRSADPVV